MGRCVRRPRPLPGPRWSRPPPAPPRPAVCPRQGVASGPRSRPFPSQSPSATSPSVPRRGPLSAQHPGWPKGASYRAQPPHSKSGRPDLASAPTDACGLPIDTNLVMKFCHVAFFWSKFVILHWVSHSVALTLRTTPAGVHPIVHCLRGGGQTNGSRPPISPDRGGTGSVGPTTRRRMPPSRPPRHRRCGPRC